MLASFSPKNTSPIQNDSPPSMSTSSLNPMRFLHRLFYSNRNLNSTYLNKSKKSLNSVRFNHDLIYSDVAFKNSTVKAKCGHYGLNLTNRSFTSSSTSPEATSFPKTSTPEFQSTPSTDLNNNDLEYSDDEEEVRVTYSYLKECAIYGVPYEGREKTFGQLVNWWLFSLFYDSKSLIVNEWDTIFILILSFIIVQLVYYFLVNL